MRQFLANPIACFLAAAYLTLAMFGHALHDHDDCVGGHCMGGHRMGGHCGEVACSESAHEHVVAAACPCEGHHARHETAESRAHDEGGAHDEGVASPGAVRVSAGVLHDKSHDCLACEVLSQLKVGYSLAPSFDRTVASGLETTLFSESADLAAWELVNGPRGPPRAA